MTAEWTYADVWETIADTIGGRDALRHGGLARSWRDFVRRGRGLGATLAGAGLGRGAKVALYLHNAPEYVEAAYGAMAVGMVPVNTNYRYVGDELLYLWTNADAEAVIFHGAFTEQVAALRDRCPAIRLWCRVEDGSGAAPDWALAYEDAVAQPPQASPAERSGDDLVLIYTGGTTGLPRGVMWRQHDLYRASNVTRDPEQADLAAVRARIAAAGTGPVGLSAAPLMHGTGFVFATSILNRGGTLVTLPDPRFSAAGVLDAIAAERVTDLCIVGNAFALPLVEALEAEPDRWDLASLKVVTSSGMMWSPSVKERLLAHAPGAVLIDFLNASEASGLGRQVTSTRSANREGARFRLGENAFVIRDDGTPVAAGSGEVGRVAVRGVVPLGYYKDPEKSAATFPVVDGVRCAVPGDYATVEADGTIALLGRGSVSINTGGEKVFPEEVEEAIKLDPAVRDAVVVGVPDARFGEVVAVVVEAAPGEVVEPARLVEGVRGRLARHKAPRHVMTVATIGRGPNGKADYPGLRRRMIDWLASDAGRAS